MLNFDIKSQMKIQKKFFLLPLIIFLLSNIYASNVSANVYVEDLEKSIDFYANEEYELSISMLDNLIKSGGLDEVSLTHAFYYRGLSNYKSNNFIAAITDITNSLWLDLLTDEEKINALETRSLARSQIGQDDLAIKDADSIEMLSNIDNLEENLNAQNIEDINIEGKINNIRDRFSINVGNFFGKEEIDFSDSPTTDYVLNDSELYNNVLNFKPEDNESQSPVLDIEKSEVEVSSEDTIIAEETLVIIPDEKLEIKQNVEKIYNEQVNYILISKDLDLSSAKVKINRIINDNFKVLSGIKPRMIESLKNDGSSKFDIIIGPFANKSRLDMIANSLTKNNYSFTIENGK